MSTAAVSLKHYEMLIDGEFVTSPKMIEVVNPTTEQVISKFPSGTVEDVNRAVLAAEKAQKSWAKLPAIQRAAHLREIASLLRANRESLAQVITEEQGKILALAQVEVDFSADYLDYMAEFARRYEGEIIQSDRPGENILLYKAPIGVIAGILPWNFPFFLIVRKMAPALVTGNTIVIKPSSETPNNAFEFAKLVQKSSLPKGVFNLVSGAGGVIGNALASHPKVGMVSLTGSVEAGAAVMHAAADNITKVSLENSKPKAGWRFAAREKMNMSTNAECSIPVTTLQYREISAGGLRDGDPLLTGLQSDLEFGARRTDLQLTHAEFAERIARERAEVLLLSPESTPTSD